MTRTSFVDSTVYITDAAGVLIRTIKNPPHLTVDPTTQTVSPEKKRPGPPPPDLNALSRQVLKALSKPMTRAEILKASGISRGHLRMVLPRLVDAGEIHKGRRPGRGIPREYWKAS